MKKIAVTTDRVLIEIGRIILTRPLFSGALLLSSIVATILSQEIWDSQDGDILAQENTMNLLLPPKANLVENDPDVSSVPVFTAEDSADINADVADAPSIEKTHKSDITSSPSPPIKTAKNSTQPKSRYVFGKINRSLSVDARKAGLSTKQVNQFVQIFSEKGLANNMHKGDSFSVILDNGVSKVKNKKTTGNILAAQLVTGNKAYQLIRFTDPTGFTDYYNAQGQSLHDGLSRAPLRYSHISSSFSNRRFDPVLGFVHPHRGIDYAAPMGTPIQAADDGVLAEADYKGGYGKAIVIKHDDKYATLYAHLSRFATGMHAGTEVKRGQLIGYVGQSGFATGPHLHFEIRVNDIPANPLTIALPGKSVPKAYRRQFFAQTKMLLAQLISKGGMQLAQGKDSTKRS